MLSWTTLSQQGFLVRGKRLEFPMGKSPLGQYSIQNETHNTVTVQCGPKHFIDQRLCKIKITTVDILRKQVEERNYLVSVFLVHLTLFLPKLLRLFPRLDKN